MRRARNRPVTTVFGAVPLERTQPERLIIVAVGFFKLILEVVVDFVDCTQFLARTVGEIRVDAIDAAHSARF